MTEPVFSNQRSPRIILVQPRGGANVGAVCRAIKNMGGGSLVTVGGDFDEDAARMMAVHADDVFDERVRVASLEEALAGCGTVVGTTARTGAYRSDSRPIREVAAELVAAETRPHPGAQSSPSGVLPSALVFGPEDRGLSNHEVARCHRLAVIPTARDYTSLNLAQAVLVCLYEVHIARLGREATGDVATVAPSVQAQTRSTTPADASGVEAMLRALEASLLKIGFLSEDNPDHIMATIRSILGRATLDERDVRTLHGIARQIAWFADGGREVADSKRKRGERLR